MVMFLSEKNARKVFKKYPNGVTAYTYVKSHKPSMDTKVDFDYVYFKELLPTPDEIASVVSGDVKAKAVIKPMVKTIRRSFGDTPREINLGIAACSVVNMLADTDMRNPRVFVFIAEDEVGDTARRTRAANKFVYKWLEALFGVFNIPVVNDKAFKTKLGELDLKCKYSDKSIKKIFKKFKKKDLRAAIRTIDSLCITTSSKVLQKCMNIAYRPELIYQTLSLMINSRGGRALTDIGKKKRHTFVEHLFVKIGRKSPAEYDRALEIATDGESNKAKKLVKKYAKNEKKADKDILNDYCLFQKIFDEISKANTEKAAKDDNRPMHTPKLPVVKKKMKPKKFKKAMKFYKKSKNMYLTGALVAHICALRMGVEFGSQEHIKAVTEMLALEDKSLANQFKITVKAFADAINKNK